MRVEAVNQPAAVLYPPGESSRHVIQDSKPLHKKILASMTTSDNNASLFDLVIDKSVKGPCNIPKAKFFDIDSLTFDQHNVETFIRLSQELHSKYQYMELSLISQKKTLHTKLEDIFNAIQTITYLKKKKEENSEEPFQTLFVISDNVYSRASVKPLQTVFLWLGANVLMEYTLEEAETLLNKNKGNAEASLANLRESLQFLRCQITTTEVNIARIHNYGVSLRRKSQSISEPKLTQ